MGQTPGHRPTARPVHRARRRWLFGALLGVAVVGVTAWFVVPRWTNSTTPIDVDDVASAFDQRTSVVAPPSTSLAAAGPTTTTSTTTGAIGATGVTTTVSSAATSVATVSSTAPLPPVVQPGVYRYASTGQEGIDVLDRPTHVYPAESAVVVSPSACGIEVEWQPLEERREWFEVCPSEGGLRLVRYGGFHRFYGQDDERSMECSGQAWLLAPDMQPGESTTAECSGSGNTDRRTTTYLRRDAVELDGVSTPVSVIRTEVEGSGATSSVSTRELWLTDGGLPVVWIDQVAGVSASVVGTVNYTEYAELRATSLVPV